MSEQKPKRFRFWWPRSAIGDKLMIFALVVGGVFSFVQGVQSSFLVGSDINEAEVVLVLTMYVPTVTLGWYFTINILRLLCSPINRPIAEWTETRREIAELEALRRRSEMKKLKEELGDDRDRP